MVNTISASLGPVGAIFVASSFLIFCAILAVTSLKSMALDNRYEGGLARVAQMLSLRHAYETFTEDSGWAVHE